MATSASLKRELAERVSSLATAGFGVVAALAWNDAIQALFQRLFGSASGIVAKFLYAAVITVVVVLVTRHLARVADRLAQKT